MPALCWQPLQVVGDVVPALLASARNARLQVEALLEVDVDDVVAADRSIERRASRPRRRCR